MKNLPASLLAILGVAAMPLTGCMPDFPNSRTNPALIIEAEKIEPKEVTKESEDARSLYAQLMSEYVFKSGKELKSGRTAGNHRFLYRAEAILNPDGSKQLEVEVEMPNFSFLVIDSGLRGIARDAAIWRPTSKYSWTAIDVKDPSLFNDDYHEAVEEISKLIREGKSSPIRYYEPEKPARQSNPFLQST